MAQSPQDAIYRPDPQITALARWIGDAVEAAPFQRTVLRFRNAHAAQELGLDGLGEAAWLAHFGRFQPLEGNLPQPLALRYHGHQFRVYNPELGDGRGFLFAQMRDGAGRLMDLGTKGSGRTPWSRRGDGRLTLKGAVREILATEMLESLGVYTSRTFSVIETGESLMRGDEPSPTRSAVLVRLSHGHIRIGTFQRLLALDRAEEMAELVDYCLRLYPGPAMPAGASEPGNRAALLLHQVVERMADLAASYMVAGFVHGVLNSDNMNISGESFDYGPWRWLPQWNPGFTAAYFDETGLYAFGRQPEAIHWNCGQLAVALRLLSDAPPLIEALDRFPALFRAAMARRWCWRLGIAPRGAEEDAGMIGACEAVMRETGTGPDAFFFAQRGKRGASGESDAGQALAAALAPYATIPGALDHPYWSDSVPVSMLIDEVEAIWARIAEDDDWGPLEAKIGAIRRMGAALAPAPAPQGQIRS